MSTRPVARMNTSPDHERADEAACRRLDLNLLEVFDAVMTERHVTRASHCLGMTQSAVSNALVRLRKRFNDQLFIKAAHGIEPTPRALALWPDLHQALETLRNMVAPTTFDPQDTTAAFRIAMSDITAALIAQHLHQQVHHDAPNAKLQFVPYDLNSTMPRLMRGELDFAFVIERQRASVVQTLPLWTDRFVVAARRDHPLLVDKLSLADFCQTPKVVVNGTGDEDALDPAEEMLIEHNLLYNVCLSVNHYMAIPSILKNSNLITIVPARFAASAFVRNDVASRPLPFPTPEVVVYLSLHQRSNTSPAHQWLKQHLLAAATAVRMETDGYLSDSESQSA